MTKVKVDWHDEALNRLSREDPDSVGAQLAAELLRQRAKYALLDQHFQEMRFAERERLRRRIDTLTATLRSVRDVSKQQAVRALCDGALRLPDVEEGASDG